MRYVTRHSMSVAAVTGILLGGIRPAVADVDPAIHPYKAVYQVVYHGQIVGRSEFSLRYDEQGERYRFSSDSRFRGLLRFISPKPLIERSEFLSAAGKITPLEFWFEDGSRRGRDNVHIAFDWSEGVATATSEEEQENQYLITQDTLDPGALQVQVMLDMARSASLGSYTLINGNGLRTYSYAAEADELIQTPLGEFSTHAFAQERVGSSRQILIWAAPKLHQLPVRIEQKRDGKTRVVFLLESVDWLSASAE